MVMNQSRLQVADNDVTIGPLKEVGVRTHVSMASYHLLTLFL